MESKLNINFGQMVRNLDPEWFKDEFRSLFIGLKVNSPPSFSVVDFFGHLQFGPHVVLHLVVCFVFLQGLAAESELSSELASGLTI